MCVTFYQCPHFKILRLKQTAQLSGLELKYMHVLYVILLDVNFTFKGLSLLQMAIKDCTDVLLKFETNMYYANIIK